MIGRFCNFRQFIINIKGAITFGVFCLFVVYIGFQKVLAVWVETIGLILTRF